MNRMSPEVQARVKQIEELRSEALEFGISAATKARRLKKFVAARDKLQGELYLSLAPDRSI